MQSANERRIFPPPKQPLKPVPPNRALRCSMPKPRLFLTGIILLAAIAILTMGCVQYPASPAPAGTSPGNPPPAAVASGTGAAFSSGGPTVAMSSPFPPIPVASANGMNLAYELELKPSDTRPFVPEKIEVLDPATGKVLYSADGDLLAKLYHPASVPPPTAAELQNGTGKLVYPRISIWFTVSPGAVPDRLTHRITLNATGPGGQPLIVTGGEVPVRKNLSPVVIGSPMKGPGWLSMETTSSLTHHFGAQITLNGVTRVPQRYAQDWIYVDPSGKVAAGNVSIAKNYYGFGKEIYAVTDGTVIGMLDGLPDIPTIFSAPPATFETAAGNYVIEDIGNGKYACYAHMVNGSVRVKKGDVLKEGQVIGLMGNSGNSDLPHLHFQVVTDTPSFLGAEGYPHVYRSFDTIGTINMTRADQITSSPGFTTDVLWTRFGELVTFFSPVHQENRLPENNDVVRFP